VLSVVHSSMIQNGKGGREKKTKKNKKERKKKGDGEPFEWGTRLETKQVYTHTKNKSKN